MNTLKKELHPRNKHKNSYDFKKLISACPDLARFVLKNQTDHETIDFSNSLSVKTLNQAILKAYYDISWDLPPHYLCPAIPGRADYIHYIADLLSLSNNGIIPLGNKISVLDIGVGANCIYPLIGNKEYGWSFVGTDIDPVVIKLANEQIINNSLGDSIEIRLQSSSTSIFQGIIKNTDNFDISICNPPFHRSLKEAKKGTERKWKNLKIKNKTLNFGGQNNELWCPGGEVAFIKRMIEESKNVPCRWFTSLISKADHLPPIYQFLDKNRALQVKTIEMGQGQKKSRLIAWAF